MLVSFPTAAPDRVILGEQVKALQRLTTGHCDALADGMLFFAKELGLGVEICGISMISKAARSWVAVRSDIPQASMTMIQEARDGGHAALMLCSLELETHWMSHAMCFHVHSAHQHVNVLDQRGGLLALEHVFFFGAIHQANCSLAP